MSPNIGELRCPRRLRIALDFVGTERWVDLTAPRGAQPDVVRINAADLRAAQRTTASIHSDALRNSADVAVLVDLEVMLADDARNALNQMNRHDALTGGPTHSDSLRYIGTPGGLAGLIGDVFTVGVADGVTVRPLSPATFDDFVDSTLPVLARFGFTVDEGWLEFLELCRPRHREAVAPAGPRRDDIPAARTA
jgi:hypothetical protein